MNEKRTILLIEDERAISNFICRALTANDYKAVSASSGKEGLSLFFSHCPDLVLLKPHHDLYRVYSKKVNAIYDEYTDLVEPFGIDESWMDVTGSLHLFDSENNFKNIVPKLTKQSKTVLMFLFHRLPNPQV